MALDLVIPDWPAPAAVCACSTTRTGGVSSGPYASLNLADHVGDETGAVSRNREILGGALGLPSQPLWLQQVHGCEVAGSADATGCAADARVSGSRGEVCAVLTADCLPVLLCDRQGSQVAAVHAGWRGLAAGVIEATVARFAAAPGDLLAWFGPAIGPAAFEVGGEVVEAFVGPDPGVESAFRPGRPGHWFADIYALARRRLQRIGVEQLYGGEYCTYSEPRRFYSYRRDGVTGRTASLIWLSADRHCEERT